MRFEYGMETFLVLLLLPSLLYFRLVSCDEEQIAAKAEIQSCSGCQLNSLPEIKAFIYKDVPNYENIVFKQIQGAPPELVLFNDVFDEIERIPLRGYSRNEANQLLKDKGFKLREQTSSKEKDDL